jgi:hypothetical protein
MASELIGDRCGVCSPCEMEKQRIDEQSPLFAHLPMMPSLYIQINQN